MSALISTIAFAQTPPPALPKPDAPPMAASKEAREHAMEGLAAYYSSRLQGRKTASGKPFDQNALTAAHPTLPFGSQVKVTNIKNGRSVIVRINDRGPTQAGRVIDLSRAAANRLGIRRGGMAQVKLEVLSAGPPRRVKL
ncbi:MAG: septal ring lytic transglycosylase RlpA family protein [Betaproteobacteria bacterium]